jgi:hypothetical protein
MGRRSPNGLRIDVAKGTPSPLFRLLCAAMLLSARINAGTAAKAAGTLGVLGFYPPQAEAFPSAKR